MLFLQYRDVDLLELQSIYSHTIRKVLIPFYKKLGEI